MKINSVLDRGEGGKEDDEGKGVGIYASLLGMGYVCIVALSFWFIISSMWLLATWFEMLLPVIMVVIIVNIPKSMMNHSDISTLLFHHPFPRS